MLLGLDFDNTLVSYDEVFRLLAINERVIDSSWTGNKLQLKNYLLSEPNGEFKWQLLQGKAYGKFMHKANLQTGVKDFLLQCKKKKIPICIVSHKTIFGIHDEEKIPLRDEALKWMHKQGFFKESLVCNLDSSIANLSKKDLIKELQQQTVSCKDVSFRIFGLSLATINTIISLILSVITIKLFFNYGKN